MSKICQITGKKVVSGNSVSHSHLKTKRKFYPNLFFKKYFYEKENIWIRLRISAAGIRKIDKLGFEKCIDESFKKGYIK